MQVVEGVCVCLVVGQQRLGTLTRIARRGASLQLPGRHTATPQHQNAPIIITHNPPALVWGIFKDWYRARGRKVLRNTQFKLFVWNGTESGIFSVFWLVRPARLPNAHPSIRRATELHQWQEKKQHSYIVELDISGFVRYRSLAIKQSLKMLKIGNLYNHQLVTCAWLAECDSSLQGHEQLLQLAASSQVSLTQPRFEVKSWRGR